MQVRALTVILLLCAGCGEAAAASKPARAELAVSAEIVGSVSASRSSDGGLTLSAASASEPLVTADPGVEIVESGGAWTASADGEGTRYVTLTY